MYLLNKCSTKSITSKVIDAAKSGDCKKLVKLLACKKASNSVAIPYTKESIKRDVELIKQSSVEIPLTDSEYAAAVILTMLHKTHKSTISLLKENGYEPVPSERLSYIGTYICTLSTINDFKSINLKKYSISSCGDERVCKVCAKHDGKVHMVANAHIGKNAPPFCDKCRCIILPIFNYSSTIK